MLRIHVARLLRARAEAEGRVIPLKEVTAATGISVAVLSKIGSPRGGATTNSRYIEALCRYFGVTPCELLELQPPLDAGVSCHVDALYPGTAQPPATPVPPTPKSTPEAPATAGRRRRAKRS
jgi:DNA-binding Xre family transcriptional regulator